MWPILEKTQKIFKGDQKGPYLEQKGDLGQIEKGPTICVFVYFWKKKETIMLKFPGTECLQNSSTKKKKKKIFFSSTS